MIIGIIGSKLIICSNKNNIRLQNILMCFFLFILSIPIGGRYEVGTDWEHYQYLFLNIYDQGFSIPEILGSNYEPLYLAWNYVIFHISNSSSFFFTCTAFIIFLFLYKANREYRYLFPLVLFFFFCSVFGASMNIIRQILASVVFYIALSYSDNKLRMCGLILLSILIHYSSAIFIVAVFLGSNVFKILDNNKVVIIVYLVCFIIGSTLYSLFLNYLPLDIMSEKYVNSVNSEETFALTSGLGVIAVNGVNILLMITSKKVRSFFSNKKVDLLYRCFFVGCFLSTFMGYSIFLSRVPLGLTNIRIFLLAFTVYYLSQRRTSFCLIVKICIILLYILFFIMGILHSDNGCSPYIFKWL